MSDPTQSIFARLLSQSLGWKILAGGLAITGLYLTSVYSYILFHTLVELFSITIGWVLFLIMWNARKWVDNRYLLILGTALAAAGGLDLVHTLAYKGLNLFPGFDANLPTQLWIAARYLQSLSMLFALLFFTARNQSAFIPGSNPEKPGRSFGTGVLVVYAIVMVGLLSLIFLRQFPVCYIEGQGLTPFKIISEYVISFILLISLAGLWLKRLHFDRTLLYLLIAATGLTIVSELAFTFYVGVYDFSNLVGHYGKLAAFFLIYLAVIQNGLQRPYSTLFRNLSQQTAALQKSEAQYRLLVENANDIIYSLSLDGILQYVSPAWTRFMGYAIPEVLNYPFESFIHPDDLPACTALFEETIRSGKDQSNIEYRVIRRDGSFRWHSSNTSLIKDPDNNTVFFLGIARDITERKLAEEALRSKEELLRSQIMRLSLALDAAQAGTWEWDIRTNENVWSDELWKLYGLDPHCGKPSYELWLETIHPDDRMEAVATVQRAARDGTELKAEWRVHERDGIKQTLVSRGRPLRGPDGQIERYIGIVMDISERKRAEEALRENEAKFRSLFHNVPMSGVIYRLIRDDQNKIVDWELQDINDRGAADLDQPSSELIGKRATALFGAEVMQPYLDLSREVVANNQPRHIETHFAHNDKYYLSAVFSLGTDFYANVSIDISERKQMEEALRESEARFRGYFEQGVIGMAITTPDKGWGVVNQTLCDQLGYTQEELAHMTWAELTHPDDLDADVVQFNRVLAGEMDSYRLEKRLICKDGQIIQIDMGVHYQRKPDGQVDYCLALFSNITERKEAEQERDRLLAETQHNAAELDAVFNALPYLVSLHGKNGQYLKVNPKIIDTFGFNPVEASREDVARRLKARFPDGQPLTPKNMPSNRALAGEAVNGVEYIITDGEGNERTLLYNAIPWKVGGEMQGAVFAQEDITERKRAEEKIQAAQVELKHLLAKAKHSRQALLNVIEDQKEAEDHVQQLNAELEQRVQDRTAQLNAANQELEAFSYSVSHDLRAPLRTMDGFSAILKSDYQDKLDQQAQHYLSRIQEASRRMGQLIEDLLNLSRITRREVKLDRVDLSLLARQIAGELHSQSTERQVEFEISPDLVVRADPGLIKIALENLLHNALKYSSKKEMALIQFGVLDQPASEGRTYFVRDNGAGFDMAYADNLFKPFQRMHGTQEFPGTGIGLTIVQRIITRHGGRIWSEASVNQGATFYFTLGTNDDPDPMGQVSRQEQFDDESRDQFR